MTRYGRQSFYIDILTDDGWWIVGLVKWLHLATWPAFDAAALTSRARQESQGGGGRTSIENTEYRHRET